MNSRQLSVLMVLLMVLWGILQWNLRPVRVVVPSGEALPLSLGRAPTAKMDRRHQHYRFGVALGGGGIKGFCHLGVLKAMEEAGVRPDILAGTSAGAVIAALYADGFSTDSILSIYDRLNVLHYLSMDLNEGGLFSLDKFKDFLDTTLHARKFEDLAIPLKVVVTDLDHGTSVVIDSGPLTEALVASCSVPILFDPYVIDGVHYVDGGLLHNLPAFALREECTYLAGISLGPIRADAYDQSMLTIALRSYRFVFRSNAHYDRALCDLLIEPAGIGNYDGGDFGQVRNIYEIGYRAGVQAMDSLRSHPTPKGLRFPATTPKIERRLQPK